MDFLTIVGLVLLTIVLYLISTVLKPANFPPGKYNVVDIFSTHTILMHALCTNIANANLQFHNAVSGLVILRNDLKFN